MRVGCNNYSSGSEPVSISSISTLGANSDSSYKFSRSTFVLGGSNSDSSGGSEHLSRSSFSPVGANSDSSGGKHLLRSSFSPVGNNSDSSSSSGSGKRGRPAHSVDQRTSKMNRKHQLDEEKLAVSEAIETMANDPDQGVILAMATLDTKVGRKAFPSLAELVKPKSLE